MARIILLLLILIGAIASVPALHDRAAGPVGRVWAHFRPAMKKATDPLRAQVTQREENAIIVELREIHAAGAALPTPEQFHHWLGLSSTVGQDGWGHDYYLAVQADSVWVGSAGPDGVAGTRDDIRTRCQW